LWWWWWVVHDQGLTRAATAASPNIPRVRRRNPTRCNFLDADDNTSRVREAYGDDTYRRLADVKANSRLVVNPDRPFLAHIRAHATTTAQPTATEAPIRAGLAA
jgi:hypothetical protein